MMTVHDIVYEQIRTVAKQQHKTLVSLVDDLPLLETGLDSLCIAILIASLDDQLDASPFDEEGVVIPITVGDLVQIYQTAKYPA
ncbi:hypothetical protein [Rhodopila sp.]|uniref:hypothetical protein n=1 Tax=Rhodopila sp. TaxID=2480087 RepID=UPI003D13C73F